MAASFAQADEKGRTLAWDADTGAVLLDVPLRLVSLAQVVGRCGARLPQTKQTLDDEWAPRCRSSTFGDVADVPLQTVV